MSRLQLSDHVIQTRQIEEQMTHWNMINKATKFKLSLVNMSQCVIRSLVCRVCTTSSLNCIGPIEVHSIVASFLYQKADSWKWLSHLQPGDGWNTETCWQLPILRQKFRHSSVEKKKGKGGERERKKSIVKNKNYFYGFNESLDGLEFKMLDYVKKRPPMNASQCRPSAVRLQLQRTPIVSSLHPLPGMYNKNSLSEKKSL